MKGDKEHWTRVADQWIAWARLPAHDAFWVYREGLTRFIGEGSGRAPSRWAAARVAWRAN